MMRKTAIKQQSAEKGPLPGPSTATITPAPASHELQLALAAPALSGPAATLQLQRSTGNRAVTRMIQRMKAGDDDDTSTGGSSTATATGKGSTGGSPTGPSPLEAKKAQVQLLSTRFQGMKVPQKEFTDLTNDSQYLALRQAQNALKSDKDSPDEARQLSYWEKTEELVQYTIHWFETQTREQLGLTMARKFDGAFAAAPVDFIRQQSTKQQEQYKKDLAATERAGIPALQQKYDQIRGCLADILKLYTESGIEYGPQELRARGEGFKTALSTDTLPLGVLQQQFQALKAQKGNIRQLENRMKEARTKENAYLRYHTQLNGEAAGDTEIRDELAAFKAEFDQVKDQSKEKGITNEQLGQLPADSPKLKSLSDRPKEAEAKALKTRYESRGLVKTHSDRIHTNRHEGGSSGSYKTPAELETLYIQEIKEQHTTTKEQWYRYFGYKQPAKTSDLQMHYESGMPEGFQGHHSIYNGPYKAPYTIKQPGPVENGVPNKPVDQVLDELYPGNSVLGAHFTLEMMTSSASAHAYRGGKVKIEIPCGPKEQFKTWDEVETFIKARQQAEEQRIRQRIEAAIRDPWRVKEAV